MGNSYHLALGQISLDELFDTFVEGNLAPGRVVLLEEPMAQRRALAAQGIETVADLVKALSTAPRRSTLAEATRLGEEYLTILGRQARSYQPASLALTRFEGEEGSAVADLEASGIRNSMHLYKAVASEGFEPLAERIGLDPASLRPIVAMADLVRITGIGPVFARRLVSAL